MIQIRTGDTKHDIYIQTFLVKARDLILSKKDVTNYKKMKVVQKYNYCGMLGNFSI